MCCGVYCACICQIPQRKIIKLSLQITDHKLDELKNKSVLFKKDGDIAIVTLNRPENIML